MTAEQIDTELVDLYADERPGIGRNVIAAFVAKGIEPPTQDAVDSRGFSATDNAIIGAYFTKHDPHNSRDDGNAGN